jgi:hypothetical protein
MAASEAMVGPRDALPVPDRAGQGQALAMESGACFEVAGAVSEDPRCVESLHARL